MVEVVKKGAKVAAPPHSMDVQKEAKKPNRRSSRERIISSRKVNSSRSPNRRASRSRKSSNKRTSMQSRKNVKKRSSLKSCREDEDEEKEKKGKKKEKRAGRNRAEKALDNANPSLLLQPKRNNSQIIAHQGASFSPSRVPSSHTPNIPTSQKKNHVI